MKTTRLLCHRFTSHEVRPWLIVIVYNLGDLWRRLALPKRIESCSLMNSQQRLVKTAGRLVKHTLCYRLPPSASHLTRHLFGSAAPRALTLPAPRDTRAARRGGFQ